MTAGLWVFALLPAVLAAAVVLHEATHYLTARMLGVTVKFEGVTTVAYEIEAGRPDWQYRLIGFAPQLVGLSTLTLLVAWYGVVVSPVSILVGGGVALFTAGSLADVSLAAARGQSPWVVSWWRGLDREARLGYLGSLGAISVVSVYLGGVMVAPGHRGVWMAASIGGVLGLAVVAVGVGVDRR